MSEEFKVQWSISTPPAAQYAKGDMLNLRGDTVAEVEAMFDVVLASEGAFLTKAQEVAALLRAAGVVSEGMAAPADNTQGSKDSEVGGGGATITRVCAHGKRVRRTGNGNRGEWAGWFCPLPKGDKNQCAVDWE